jgi:hypothetical protein
VFRTRPLAALALAAALLFASAGAGDDKPKADPKADPKAKPDDKAAVMKKKLTLSQKILEGLALEDFDKIKTGADDLIVVRQQAAFMVGKTAKYEVYANDFQKHLEEIQKAAKKKNVEAAALGYVEMTLTCVRCHQYVRDEKIGAAPLLKPDVLTQKAER